MQVRRSMLVAGHGGTAALLNAVLAVSGHREARRGAQQYKGDLVTLFQQHKPHEKFRRSMATARWRGGQNAMAQVIVFRAGGTTNGGNLIAPANTHTNQALTLSIGRKAHASRAVASLPLRRPWRPRFRREGKKAIHPHRSSIDSANMSGRWRWTWCSYGRDGDGGGAVERTQGDGGGEAVLGGEATLWEWRKRKQRTEIKSAGMEQRVWDAIYCALA